MTSPYYEAIQLIERLHRYFLDVVKSELDRKGVQDINNVQAMILYACKKGDKIILLTRLQPRA